MRCRPLARPYDTQGDRDDEGRDRQERDGEGQSGKVERRQIGHRGQPEGRQHELHQLLERVNHVTDITSGSLRRSLGSMSELREILGIRHPILLGAFGGMSSVALTAAVSEAGGLGAYGLYGYDGARVRSTAAALREATDKPFALNIWLPTGDEVPPGPQHTVFAQALEPFYEAVGVPVPPRPESYLPTLDEQLEAIWDAAPAALSVVYGVPSGEIIEEEAHRRGIRVIGTATTVAEAVALEAGGVDVVIASGAEAAGHRVSFLRGGGVAGGYLRARAAGDGCRVDPCGRGRRRRRSAWGRGGSRARSIRCAGGRLSSRRRNLRPMTRIARPSAPRRPTRACSPAP